MSIEIRRAVPEDAKAILELCKIFGSESDNLTYGAEGLPYTVEQEEDFLIGIQNSCKQVFLVALEDGHIVGTANFSAFFRERMAHRGEIGISVRKSHWGKGIGSALMKELLTFAKNSAKADVISLEVRSDNLRAIHLYEKFGFQKTGMIPAFFKINGEYADVDLMSLFLNK